MDCLPTGNDVTSFKIRLIWWAFLVDDVESAAIQYCIHDHHLVVCLKVVNLQTGQECSVEEKGEIMIRGPQKMLGYLTSDAQSNAGKVDSGGWLRTGLVVS